MLMKTGVIHQGNQSRQDDDTTYLIAGRSLAHAKFTTPERAFLAADLHLNRVDLVCPTIKQAAYLAGVCVPYAAAALAIADNPAARAAVLAGDCTLMDAAKAVVPESLAVHFARATRTERIEFARTAGVDLIWDELIQPLID